MENRADTAFYHLGSLPLPEGSEGRELHFFISRGIVEVWSLPSEPSPAIVEKWLSDRRNALAISPGPCEHPS